MEYYRCEITYRNRNSYGIFQRVYKIRQQIVYLEDLYEKKFEKSNDMQDFQVSNEYTQDYDWLEEIMAYLEDDLKVPPIPICKQGLCAYTEEGYKKFKEHIEDYRYLAGKYGYSVKVRKVQPKKILYQDEMQIVFQ